MNLKDTFYDKHFFKNSSTSLLLIGEERGGGGAYRIPSIFKHNQVLHELSLNFRIYGCLSIVQIRDVCNACAYLYDCVGRHVLYIR